MQIPIFEHARKNKTENGEGNRDGEWNFCPRKKADIALFSHVTRLRKIKKPTKAPHTTITSQATQ